MRFNLPARISSLFTDTIFHRLFGLAFAAVLLSHLATFVLLFVVLRDELRPPPPPAHGLPPAGIIDGPWFPLITGMVLQLLILGIAIWIGSRNLAKPMQVLATAASQLGESQQIINIDETGPLEARQTALRFNQMQLRLHQQREERERFLAAVSHDLRTPLTRMKLRVEQNDATPGNDKLLQDIDEMRSMLDATLNYLRGGTSDFQLLDIQSLSEAIVENMQDEGKHIRISGQARPLRAMPAEIQRCLTNLIDNAIFYGEKAEVVLHDHEHELHIRIQDQGPGIHEQELDNVFQPFYRLDSSRSRHSGGVGLGLSIAKEIVRQHQGSLTLKNHPVKGLIAEIVLPRNRLS